jgi:hypothetical protein
MYWYPTPTGTYHLAMYAINCRQQNHIVQLQNDTVQLPEPQGGLYPRFSAAFGDYGRKRMCLMEIRGVEPERVGASVLSGLSVSVAPAWP